MSDGEQSLDLQAKLAALETLFQARLQDRLSEIGSVLALCLSTPGAREHPVTLHRLLHTLAGSAGTFGFAELGRRAHALESQLSKLLSPDPIDPASLLQLGARINDYLLWCATNPREHDTPKAVSPLQINAMDGPGRPVYVVDDDVLLSKDIALQLEYFGYHVIIVNHLEQLSAAIAKQPPAAVIMDMMFGQDGSAGASELKRIKHVLGLNFPSIFISASNQYEKRLAAVRAGADAYFPKPLDVLALSDRLDVLTARKEFVPYRILIVDDDPIASAYHSAVLENAGMEVTLLNAPAQILGALSKFQPELVLMDVYMPDCSGIELAKLIRQDNKYLDMPIVFLSSEEDFGKQLDAIESGADDFLTKPIAPEHLASSIQSRGQRYRALRSLIMRDSLTLLFNHSAIKEHLSREMARARRAGSELALAMIDLDCFKHVNDTYGHPVGDHVIRALARLLQQRLRRCDIVGRYGGEEFAVIFPATSASSAKMVLDKIREFFNKIHHHGNGTEFSVSFSAGIAAMGGSDDGEALFRDADEALYRAKQGGRNRVEQA